MPSSDREVLLALYRATGGPHWIYKGGWDTSDDISSWYGVTARDGHVLKLSLGSRFFGESNNLQGPIPKELGQLSYLKELNLSRNELNGPIPKELGQLTSLGLLDFSYNKLDGTIPLELVDIPTIERIDCRGNSLFGILPMHISGEAEVLRSRQIAHGDTVDGLAHSYLWLAVEYLTSIWHFLLPVLDDITDLWLLLETSGGSHRGLWWACLLVFVIADIERVYTAFFFVVSIVSFILLLVASILFVVVTCCLCLFCCIDCLSNVSIRIMTTLAGQKEIVLLLDSLLWTLFGSRARSSPFMTLFGQGGDATGGDLMNSGLGLHGIDVILFFHPMRYLGEFLLTFPRGHRRPEVANRHQAKRREIAMVRAVGETLCVDPLFLALSVVTGDWDDNFTGLAMVSALFSMLELVTELQYYVTEAEVATPSAPTAVGNDNHSRSSSATGDAV